MKNIKIYLLFLLSLAVVLSCGTKSDRGEPFIELKDWEVNIGSGWEKTAPVSWETPGESGGIGAFSHDGFGRYRIKFRVPESFKETSAAFYTNCIDDSDIAYLNGRKIGETGKFPGNRPGTGSRDPDQSFRSGVREPRLYVVPNEILKYGEENELVIKVYDFSGDGGFCFDQRPVIGPYDALVDRAKRDFYINDVPRTAFLSLLLFLAAFYGIRLILLSSSVRLKDVVRSIIQPFNLPGFLVNSTAGLSDPDIDTQIASRYVISIFICLMSFLYLFSEVTYKYYFIESELFWFKFPPMFFFLLLTALLGMFHPDVFGPSLHFHGKSRVLFIRAAASVLSHPLIIFMFFLYTCIMPAREAWSYFMLFGLVYGFFSVAILFSITGINMVRFGSRESALFHKYFRYEGAARLILISGIFLAISLSLLKVIKGWEFMTMNIFLIIYLMVSISFLTHRRIRLPLKTIDSMPLFVILQKEFSFTYKESSIACLVHEGYTRNDICSRLDITNETIKKHLKSIYKKSIEKNPGFDVSGRDKFQKLTLFLSRIR